MIMEISWAAEAPEWEKEMLKFMRTKKGVHPDVVDFCSAGDMPPDLTQNTFMKPFGTDQKEDLEKNYFGLFKPNQVPGTARPKNNIPGKKDLTHATKDWNNTLASVGKVETCGICTDTIDVNWSWGMKFLFQAIALQKSTFDKEKQKDDKWRLWPFAQPHMNNRLIDVEEKLWNEKDTTTQQMIPTVLSGEGINFDTQKAFSVPCVLQPHSDDDRGWPLCSMTKGPGDDETFHRNSAFKCTKDKMAACFSALTVRLRSSSLSCVV
jgi:hypothetical protein